MDINSIVIAALVIGIIFLVFCIIYLVWVYRKTLERYYDLLRKEEESETKRSIRINLNRFTEAKVDEAISKSLSEASELILRSAKSVVSSMKRKTAKELVEERQAVEKAVAAEFDEARLEIEKYKEEKYAEIRVKANEVLERVVNQAMSSMVEDSDQERLVIKAIDDAKRSKLL